MYQFYWICGVIISKELLQSKNRASECRKCNRGTYSSKTEFKTTCLDSTKQLVE